MKKHRFIVSAVLAVSLLVILATVAIKRSRESIEFRGQPLQVWCVQAYGSDSNALAAMKELGTNAVPELLRLLKTRDSFFREQTWAHLPKLPVRLRRTVAQRYPPPQAQTVREAAAHALGRLGADANVAVPHLARALNDNQGRVRWEAATALGRIGKDSVPALIEALREKDASARHAAAYALGQLGPDASAAIPALVERIDDQDQVVRNAAASCLAGTGTCGVLALLDIAEKGQEPGREVAISTLTRTYSPSLKVTREFFVMAQSDSPAIRQRAIEVLGVIRPVGSSAVLASVQALQDPTLEVRLAAIKTLGARTGTNRKGTQALTDCLRDESARIREAAALALGQIGGHASAAIPELSRLAEEPDESVRAAAKAAMGRITQSQSAPARAN